MIKNIIIVIFGLVIIGGGIFFWTSNNNSKIEDKVENEEKAETTEKKSGEKKSETKLGEKLKEENEKKEGNKNIDVNLDSGKNIIGGGIQFNDKQENENQNLAFGNLTFNNTTSGISMNDVDITTAVILEKGEIWLANNIGHCGLSKMRILSQDSNYKEVELTTKSSDKFQTTFYKNNYTLEAKNNVNYIAPTEDGDKNVTALRMHYPVRKNSDGKKYIDKNSIYMFGGDKNKDQEVYCVDFFQKQQ